MTQTIGPISTASTMPRLKRQVDSRMAMLEKLQRPGKKGVKNAGGKAPRCA